MYVQCIKTVENAQHNFSLISGCPKDLVCAKSCKLCCRKIYLIFFQYIVVCVVVAVGEITVITIFYGFSDVVSCKHGIILYYIS